MNSVIEPTLGKPSPLWKAVVRYSRPLHTYASMLILVMFLFFASTGFMLNHPDWFGLEETHTKDFAVTVPANVLASKDKLTLVEYLRTQGATGEVQKFDWADEGEPFHVAFKSPGAQCDADITTPSGETKLTVQTYGTLGLMSRLHTAKDAGRAWRLLLDGTALLVLFVSLTGVIMWQSLPKRRNVGVIAFTLSVAAVVGAYVLCVP